MSTCQWNNWAGSLYASPAECPAPTSVADVQNIIKASKGKTVRAFGSGHSWTPLVPTDSVIVDPTGITDNGRKAWRWQQNGRDLVTYLPSARFSDVRAALTDTSVNLPLMYVPTAGVVQSINATGFAAAGCHGTGWMQPTVSDLVYAVEFVGADGQLHVFSEDTTPNEMNIVRVNLGMLGLITKITLKVEEMFRLHDVESVMETADVMGPNPASNNGQVDPSKLSALITGNDYVELFWFPWSGWYLDWVGKLGDGQMWVKQWNRTQAPPTTAPPQPPDWQDYFAEMTMELVAENTPKGSLGHGLIPGIQLAMWFVADAPTVFHYQDYAFPVVDLEVAIPIPCTGNNQYDFTNVVKAWYEIINIVRAAYGEDLFPLTVCQHARFIKNSQSLLSPAYEPEGSDTHYCWIEVLSAYPKKVQQASERDRMIADYNNLLQQIVPTWVNDMNGRPHWAKYWQNVTGIDVKSLYPAANRSQFNSLRSTLDPGGMFMNDFLKGLNLFGS
jgi:hypothetical protein